ncbi:hypothetical protein EK21DRAFT_95216 [Setomelanomma holmii]|uniref:Uncharacterized protein n=1 Tax=Setomelanomma holmii TaxID=210430 RepID=A0A9P4LGC8_9PLEO|nr:hypothetical protein EK21DRAFT_95216 [Setomelanomma holmii]
MSQSTRDHSTRSSSIPPRPADLLVDGRRIQREEQLRPSVSNISTANISFPSQSITLACSIAHANMRTYVMPRSASLKTHASDSRQQARNDIFRPPRKMRVLYTAQHDLCKMEIRRRIITGLCTSMLHNLGTASIIDQMSSSAKIPNLLANSRAAALVTRVVADFRVPEQFLHNSSCVD